MISKENVLKVIKGKPTIKDAIEAVKKMPDESWISCDDRLPEIGEYHESETVLCATKEGFCFSPLVENIFGQVWFECEQDDEYHESFGKVIAWMPIPKLDI